MLDLFTIIVLMYEQEKGIGTFLAVGADVVELSQIVNRLLQGRGMVVRLS